MGIHETPAEKRPARLLRRRLQFGFGTLLVVMAFISIVVAWQVERRELKDELRVQTLEIRRLELEVKQLRERLRTSYSTW